MMNAITKELKLNDGRIISIETGKLAKQANGAVVVKMGSTMLLATVVTKKEANQGVDYLPLSVDYKEKYAAVGRFPGGFFKREARPSDYEILICRLVDRALRPLFPKDYHADIVVQIALISADKEIMPDSLAALAASAAISVSDIPFNGPISEVRVARINGEFIINPNFSDIPNADLDIIVAATMDNIMMVEGEMKEVAESDLIEAIKFAHETIKEQCQIQIELASEVEKSKVKLEYQGDESDQDLCDAIRSSSYDKLYEASRKCINIKSERKDAIDAIKQEYIESLDEEVREEKAVLIENYFHDIHKDAVRNMAIDEKIRLDGRKPDEIRPIWSEVDYLPAAHGSAIFTRGETQSLTSLTLGSKNDLQIIDGAIIEGKAGFILHYNFPGFSTGEAKPIRGTSRREVGHGNLAPRALKNVIPNDPENPYTIRLVSDILESNGSSSMATVCAGTLALMDAGVQIHKPVSGIAMGLIMDNETRKYTILSDILGDEDHLGDMDFKVTGTRDGITACQMDIKVDGLPYEILADALEQARNGRIHILDEMAKTIDKPNADYKAHAPRIITLTVAKEFIGAIIGPGGKIIQEIQAETNTTINIEEVGEFGIVDIMSNDLESIEAAKTWIKNITAVPEIGEVYNGTVKNITSFGAFVEIIPGKDGLLHISEIEWRRINDVNDVLKTGDKIEVKLIDIDKKTGKLKLSRKVLLPRPDKQ
ncbi:MAG: polyribonucleotide nucleotidyltransferase [Bacteroidales bacterium]|nr:polyribonucleotide nucleotidyltransferase [Bacteroidales bacterium]